mmetsp:Transcript_8686/g.23908  ORF Transcript_8686/g.23908 Transcript_8686/m.23908 type:complete len:211 (-) Transcript_8686:323-955(-)|eukprot:CAMPEP_0185541352 /NCGR_PEP_ID=MMETSP1381-20130426/1909_1 /TAXON_ID=298111 /ORGANISM="Pavlova sp., Strain CCMP459" /LENGTH=210 /DNA_ID=CAMNT_0028153255 /DNA_START=20 /DNA_END=652 /DNA_ORIENTATION=+
MAAPPGSKQTAIVTGGRKKVSTTLPDGTEVIEEFDVQTDQLLVRKRRGKTVLGRELDWIYEVGAPPERHTIANDTLKESNANPIFSRADRIDCFEWRVRNLPFPKGTYSVIVDHSDRKIVIRTSNKKYYKRIAVEDMDRLQLPLEDAALQWDHDNNTLVVQYRKPQALIAAEREAAAARRKLGTQDDPGANDGGLPGHDGEQLPAQCAQQ